MADKSVHIKTKGAWVKVSPAPGGSFIGLTDVPAAYTGAGYKLVRVNTGETALEFATLQGTSNQVTVTPGAGVATLSLPQDIHTAGSPTFATVKLSGLTDGYVPYHVADATGLADSVIQATATTTGFGVAPTASIVATFKAAAASEATLGATMLTNGDFATNDLTGWTAAAGWSAATGKAVHTGGIADTTPLTQSVNLTNGKVYEVVVVTSGGTTSGLTLTFGSLEGSYDVGAAGTVKKTFKATSTAAFALTFTPTAAFDRAVDDITVKLITVNATPAVQIFDSAGSSFGAIRGSYVLGNLGMGYNILRYNTTGLYNSAFGHSALGNNTTGSYNVAGGASALYANTTGSNNAAFGYAALNANTTGSNNAAFGYAALYANTTGSYNNAFGYAALNANTTGYDNCAWGYLALYANTTGYGNSGAGSEALRANTTGYGNTAKGANALRFNTTGSKNSALGGQALYDLDITANDGTGANTAVGYNTGRGIVTGVNNTILGANVTGLAAALSSNIILANGAGTIKAQHDGTNWTLTGNVGMGGATIGSLAGILIGTAGVVSAITNSSANWNTAYGWGDHSIAGYALTTRKLDDFGAPDNNTDLDATTSAHGLLPKLGGGTTNFLRADGTYAAPPGGSGTGLALTVGGGLIPTPSDGSTYYFGGPYVASVGSTADIRRMYCPMAGTIKVAYIFWYADFAGSGENVSMYIRLNNTSDTLIATIGNTDDKKVFSKTDLSIAVVQGDYIEIKMVSPTWATNPLNVYLSGVVYIE